jgi:DNA-directed RNA polymerase sigma subunit (sigma70/sigma32)
VQVEEDSHLGDLIEDENAVLPTDAAIQSNLRETTTRVLATRIRATETMEHPATSSGSVGLEEAPPSL